MMSQLVKAKSTYFIIIQILVANRIIIAYAFASKLVGVTKVNFFCACESEWTYDKEEICGVLDHLW